MALTIRPLTAADEAEWRRLWTGYLEFYESAVSEEVYQTTFARLLDPAHTERCCFIADLDGRAVGLVHAIWHAHNWRIEDVCYLQDLYADPDVRGKGIGGRWPQDGRGPSRHPVCLLDDAGFQHHGAAAI